MDAERAAAILGVPLDADRRTLAAAFAREARRTHPDADGGDAAAFRDVVAARDVLLRRHDIRDGTGRADVPTAAEDDHLRRSVVVAVAGPRRQGPLLLATWVAILLVAAFLGTAYSASPFGVIDPVLRWSAVLVTSLAFALTGRRPLLLVAAAGWALGMVVILLGGVSWGALMAQLLAIPALYGFALAGIAQGRFRARLPA